MKNSFAPKTSFNKAMKISAILFKENGIVLQGELFNPAELAYLIITNIWALCGAWIDWLDSVLRRFGNISAL